jgi:hypothetical protein
LTLKTREFESPQQEAPEAWIDMETQLQSLGIDLPQIETDTLLTVEASLTREEQASRNQEAAFSVFKEQDNNHDSN